MRLFMIGHFAKGKSTLLKFLSGSPAQSTFDSRTGRVGTDARDLSASGTYVWADPSDVSQWYV